MFALLLLSLEFCFTNMQHESVIHDMEIYHLYYFVKSNGLIKYDNIFLNV